MELLRREKKNLVVQSVVLECHKWTLCLVVKAMGHDEISTWQRACSVLFGRGGGVPVCDLLLCGPRVR